MALVTLTRLWVHDANDLADNITVDLAAPIDDTPSVLGEVRSYGGRRRIVLTEEESRTVIYRTSELPRADLEWLLDRLGQLLLWRDERHRLLWGATFAVPYQELGHRSDTVSASWTVVETTHTVEV